jgi:hypothetical protein
MPATDEPRANDCRIDDRRAKNIRGLKRTSKACTRTGSERTIAQADRAHQIGGIARVANVGCFDGPKSGEIAAIVDQVPRGMPAARATHRFLLRSVLTCYTPSRAGQQRCLLTPSDGNVMRCGPRTLGPVNGPEIRCHIQTLLTI